VLDMNSSDINNLNILDLPNEILFIIFNKLNTVDALYSLVDVNERFDELVLDSLHIRNLDTVNMIIKSNFDHTISIDNRVLSRICEKILPRIHHQLNELTVEQHSIYCYLSSTLLVITCELSRRNTFSIFNRYTIEFCSFKLTKL
jgi:hypothetical protein